MATTNKTVTNEWTLLVLDSVTTVLAQPTESCLFEVATVATQTEPTVEGHKIRQKLEEPDSSITAITRDLLGDGFIYGRVLDKASVVFAIT